MSLLLFLFDDAGHTVSDRRTEVQLHDLSREDAIAYLKKHGVCGKVRLSDSEGEVNVEEYLVDNVCGCRYRQLNDTARVVKEDKGDDLAAVVAGISAHDMLT